MEERGQKNLRRLMSAFQVVQAKNTPVPYFFSPEKEEGPFWDTVTISPPSNSNFIKLHLGCSFSSCLPRSSPHTTTAGHSASSAPISEIGIHCIPMGINLPTYTHLGTHLPPQSFNYFWIFTLLSKERVTFSFWFTRIPWAPHRHSWQTGR